MEVKKIRKIVEDVTLRKMNHMNGYTVRDIEDTLIEKLSKALGKSDVRISCLQECWEMWLKCDSEKDFVRWLHGQLHES
jgi:hypothetical protein